MGFMDKLKMRFMSDEDKKFYQDAVAMERSKVQKAAKANRREELREMAKMEALPPAQRVAAKARNIKRNLDTGAGKYKKFNDNIDRINKKLGVGSGLLASSMKGGGGQMRDAMLGSGRETGKKMKKGKTIKITFE